MGEVRNGRGKLEMIGSLIEKECEGHFMVMNVGGGESD